MESIARYCNGQYVAILMEFARRISAECPEWKST